MAELIVPPSLRAAHRQGLARFLETEQAVVLDRRLELTGMHKNGTEFPVELTITRIALPGPPTFTGYLRDITDRKQAEAELRASRARLVEVADAERRRIQRNLHDGAQQRLTAVLLSLGRLREAPERARGSARPRDRRARRRAAGDPRARERPAPVRPRPSAASRRRSRRSRSARPSRSSSQIELEAPAPGAGRGRRLLRRRRGARQRPQARRRRPGRRARRGSTNEALVVEVARRRRAAEPTSRAAVCAGSPTGSKRSAERSRSRARPAAARACSRGCQSLEVYGTRRPGPGPGLRKLRSLTTTLWRTLRTTEYAGVSVEVRHRHLPPLSSVDRH